jgi:hypothetical protein
MTTAQAHLVARSANGRLERCFTEAKDAHRWIATCAPYLGMKVYRCDCSRNVKSSERTKTE